MAKRLSRVASGISGWLKAHAKALATVFGFTLGTIMTVAEVQQAMTANQLAKLEVETTIYFSKSEQRFRLLEMLYSDDCSQVPCRPSYNSRIRSEALHELVNLEGSIGQRVVLREARLQGTKTYGIDLASGDLERADLSEANFSGADLSLATLAGANLSGASLSGASLSGAQLTDQNAVDLVLDGVKGDDRTRLSGVFRRASLQLAELARGDLSGVQLVDSNLSGADLSGAQLTNAVLTGSNMSGTDLRDADLTGADLSGAILHGTDLRGAILDGANLATAKITLGKKLMLGALADDETQLPPGFEGSRYGLTMR